MKINLMLFINAAMMKTFESNIRPVAGDIIADPGFHPKFHNGYEVVKVTINYATEECWVSLAPLVIDLEEISVEAYIAHLKEHGWREVSKEELIFK